MCLFDCLFVCLFVCLHLSPSPSTSRQLLSVGSSSQLYHWDFGARCQKEVPCSSKILYSVALQGAGRDQVIIPYMWVGSYQGHACLKLLSQCLLVLLCPAQPYWATCWKSTGGANFQHTLSMLWAPFLWIAIWWLATISYVCFHLQTSLIIAFTLHLNNCAHHSPSRTP